MYRHSEALKRYYARPNLSGWWTNAKKSVTKTVKKAANFATDVAATAKDVGTLVTGIVTADPIMIAQGAYGLKDEASSVVNWVSSDKSTPPPATVNSNAIFQAAKTSDINIALKSKNLGFQVTRIAGSEPVTTTVTVETLLSIIPQDVAATEVLLSNAGFKKSNGSGFLALAALLPFLV